jgi:hypothetical protein
VTVAAHDIFGTAADVNTTYRATLRFRHLVVGGIPSDRSVIEGWIRSRMELGDQAVADLVVRTARERGVLTPDEAVALVMASELAPSVNGFKRDDSGVLCLEGRQVKAALKEWSNSAYPGTIWPGKPAGIKKGLMRFLAEAVTVPDVLIPLGVTEPTTVEERIKHVMTAQGPRSSINRVEVVERPTITFRVQVRDDFLPVEAWARIWTVGEGIGLGADRGRSDGSFDLVEWTRLPASTVLAAAS